MMTDPVEDDQQPDDGNAEAAGPSVDEEGGPSLEYIAGAQASFAVSDTPPIPKAIQTLKEEGLRQRAEMAWKSLFLLDEELAIWKQFLTLGHLGSRITPEVDARINELFPELKDFGAVVEAVAVDVAMSGHEEAGGRKLTRSARSAVMLRGHSIQQPRNIIEELG
jgi:hypothetical protein